ncbi:hypothetical protein [Gilvimarinus algae]|uniref:Uncharacterized protein n=1 Tax=Gilvimarinus algae TaxID=3058037 RepID=A0ABT8TI00_9GAMM|nr:hypothetical protein [Gilvimarinus sp. SDUM040014]MDO3383732.1 hypothetical protein [Gilvimarinus sp. SDUM040014]
MLSPFHPLQMALGLIVWALYFVVIYSGLSVVCTHSPPPAANAGALNTVNLALLALTFAVALSLFYQAWRGNKALRKEVASHAQSGASEAPLPTRQFIARIAVATYLVAGTATLLTGLPALVLIPCV